MRIADVLEAAATSAREIKAEKVRRERGVPGECDVPPTLLVYRGLELAAIVIGGRDRDEALLAARLAAFGFDADTLVAVLDTFLARTPTSPMTGQDWAPHEMARLAAEHDGIARGWVTEALTLSAVNRADDLALANLPYAVTGRRIAWAEPTSIDGATFTGAVPDGLCAAMREPSMSVAAARDGIAFGTHSERTRAHCDIATVRSFAERLSMVGVALAAESGTLRAALIREAFPGARMVWR